MDRARYIGLDAHARTCDLGCVTATGNKSGHWVLRGLPVVAYQARMAVPMAGRVHRIVHARPSFEYEPTRTGVRYAAPEGLHDDCVVALALANEQARGRCEVFAVFVDQVARPAPVPENPLDYFRRRREDPDWGTRRRGGTDDKHRERDGSTGTDCCA